MANKRIMNRERHDPSARFYGGGTVSKSAAESYSDNVMNSRMHVE